MVSRKEISSGLKAPNENKLHDDFARVPESKTKDCDFAKSGTRMLITNLISKLLVNQLIKCLAFESSMEGVKGGREKRYKYTAG